MNGSDEKEHLQSLTKKERRFLARRVCAWCELPLHYTGCAAIYQKCDEAARIDRRKRCLANYKPGGKTE